METDITQDPTLNEDGIEAVKTDTEGTSIKDILSKTLGKDFPSDDAALKAVKDTFSYVGKKKEEVAKEVIPQIDLSNYVSKAEFEEATFYAKNPNLEQLKTVLSAMSKSSGKSLSEVAASEDFKSLYSKVDAYDKNESSKSILQTNPRLGNVKDTIEQAKEALKSGNKYIAGDLAAKSVIDAFEL